jgi:hypothetical protein
MKKTLAYTMITMIIMVAALWLSWHFVHRDSDIGMGLFGILIYACIGELVLSIVLMVLSGCGMGEVKIRNIFYIGTVVILVTLIVVFTVNYEIERYWIMEGRELLQR